VAWGLPKNGIGAHINRKKLRDAQRYSSAEQASADNRMATASANSLPMHDPGINRRLKTTPVPGPLASALAAADQMERHDAATYAAAVTSPMRQFASGGAVAFQPDEYPIPKAGLRTPMTVTVPLFNTANVYYGLSSNLVVYGAVVFNMSGANPIKTASTFLTGSVTGFANVAGPNDVFVTGSATLWRPLYGNWRILNAGAFANLGGRVSWAPYPSNVNGVTNSYVIGATDTLPKNGFIPLADLSELGELRRRNASPYPTPWVTPSASDTANSPAMLIEFILPIGLAGTQFIELEYTFDQEYLPTVSAASSIALSTCVAAPQVVTRLLAAAEIEGAGATSSALDSADKGADLYDAFVEIGEGVTGAVSGVGRAIGAAKRLAGRATTWAGGVASKVARWFHEAHRRADFVGLYSPHEVMSVHHDLYMKVCGFRNYQEWYRSPQLDWVYSDDVLRHLLQSGIPSELPESASSRHLFACARLARPLPVADEPTQPEQAGVSLPRASVPPNAPMASWEVLRSPRLV